jgi:hypothetical protein
MGLGGLGLLVWRSKRKAQAVAVKTRSFVLPKLLSAWLPRRKTAKPRRQRHQYKSQSGSGQTLVKIAFLSGFPLHGHDQKSRRQGD